MQREALLRPRAQPAEDERHVLRQQVRDGLVLLAELAGAGQLVGVERAGDLLAADGDGDARAAERLARAHGEVERVGWPSGRALRRVLAHRAPLVGGPLRRLADGRGGDHHAVALDGDDDAVGVEELGGEGGDDGGQGGLVGGAVDLAEGVDEDAQPVALEEGGADELHEVAHRLVELADGLGRERRLIAGRLPHVLDVIGEGLHGVAAVDADLEVGERAVGRVGDVGEGVHQRAAGLLERLDAGDRPLGHHAVDDAPPERAETRADGQPVAPRGGGPEDLLRAAEPDGRRLVAETRRPRGQQLGEADHRPPFAAPQPRVVEALDGAAEALPRVVRVPGVRGVARRLQLERRRQEDRPADLHHLVGLRELGVRLHQAAGLPGDLGALDARLGLELDALVRIHRVVGARLLRRRRRYGSARQAGETRFDQPRASGDAGGGEGRTERADARRVRAVSSSSRTSAAAARAISIRASSRGFLARTASRRAVRSTASASSSRPAVSIMAARRPTSAGRSCRGASGNDAWISAIQRAAHRSVASPSPAGGGRTADIFPSLHP